MPDYSFPHCWLGHPQSSCHSNCLPGPLCRTVLDRCRAHGEGDPTVGDTDGWCLGSNGPAALSGPGCGRTWKREKGRAHRTPQRSGDVLTAAQLQRLSEDASPPCRFLWGGRRVMECHLGVSARVMMMQRMPRGLVSLLAFLVCILAKIRQRRGECSGERGERENA